MTFRASEPTGSADPSAPGVLVDLIDDLLGCSRIGFSGWVSPAWPLPPDLTHAGRPGHGGDRAAADVEGLARHRDVVLVEFVAALPQLDYRVFSQPWDITISSDAYLLPIACCPARVTPWGLSVNVHRSQGLRRRPAAAVRSPFLAVFHRGCSD